MRPSPQPAQLADFGRRSPISAFPAQLASNAESSVARRPSLRYKTGPARLGIHGCDWHSYSLPVSLHREQQSQLLPSAEGPNCTPSALKMGIS